MFENAYEMFDLDKIEFRKSKKKVYEERVGEFRENYGHYIDEMLSYVGSADSKEEAALTVGKDFSENVFNHFAKKGKIRGIKKADLCMFMIYYVFPSILLTENENAELTADKLLEVWRDKFDNPQMGYTTYENILSSFKEKIFGFI